MDVRRITPGAALVAVAALCGGCAVYPAQPVFATFPSAPVVVANTAPGTTVAPAPVVVAPAPVVVAPAPVFLAPPPPVFWGPAFYPSVSIGVFGRFGGGGRRRR